MKPFLILQLRPETEAADDEYAAFLAKGGLDAGETERYRLEREDVPAGIDLARYSGVIVGGGPGCVSDPQDEKTPEEKRIEASILALMPAIVERDVPFLGCCYGIGVLAHFLGAEVSKARFGEPVGPSVCQTTEAGKHDPLTAGLPERFTAFVGHKEAVQVLPRDSVHLVSSGPCPFQMIRHREHVYATQFHPELDADGIATRIRIYRDRGYFPPDSAEDLIAKCRAEDVFVPERILRGFVDRYRAR